MHSFGVSITVSIGLANTTLITLIRIPATSVIVMAFPTIFFTYSSFPAPKFWEIIMPTPAPIPMHNEKNKKLTLPTDPIAGRPYGPPNCPTIIVSARL